MSYLRLLFILLIVSISIFTPAVAMPLNHKQIKLKQLMPHFLEADKNMNHIDDYLEEKLAEGSTGKVNIIIMLSTPPRPIHLRIAKLLGGKIIGGPWHGALNGFAVLIDYSKIYRLYSALLQIDTNKDGYSDLYFIQMERTYRAQMYWATRQIYVRPMVWKQLGISGENVTVAILDTGIDIDAPGIDPSKIIAGYDATNTSLDPYTDEVGHGTAVASTIIGRVEEGVPINWSIATRITHTGNQLLWWEPVYIPASGTISITAFISPFSSTYGYNAGVQLHIYRVNDPMPVNINWSIDNSYYTYIGYLSFADTGSGYLGEATGSLSVSPGTYFFYITGIDTRWASDNSTHLLILLEYIPLSLGNDGYPDFIGVAPNASVASVKITNTTTATTISIINGLNWTLYNADKYNIDIVSLSFTAPAPDPVIGNLTLNLYLNGISVVVAAGNTFEYGGGVGYPAVYPWVLAVGAVNRINQITFYSANGTLYSYNGTLYYKPDIVAPGGGLDSALMLSESNDNSAYREPRITDGYYVEALYDMGADSGTSFSAPIVAGVAALVYSALKHNGTYDLFKTSDPEYLSLLVYNILKASASETYPLAREYPYNTVESSPTYDYGSKDPHEGYGLIDAYSAVWTALLVADIYLGYYPLDYSPYNNMQFLWTFVSSIRNGTIYNGRVRYPFGSSSLTVPAHFERYTLELPNGETVYSKYLFRYIVNKWYNLSALNFDMLFYIMAYPDPIIDGYLRINSSNLGYNNKNNWYEGYAYYTPPPEEQDNETPSDLTYFVVIKRAMENSSGVEELRLLFGPSLYIDFKPGSYFNDWGTYVYLRTLNPLDPDIINHKVIWLFWWRDFNDPSNTYFLGYYANETPAVGYTTIHRNGSLIITPISNATSGDGYIKLETDLITPSGTPLYYIPPGIIEVWTLVVDPSVDTSDFNKLNNTLTADKIYAGPVGGFIDLYEPVYVFSAEPQHIRDNEPFTVYVKLLDPDTGTPLSNEKVYFYYWIPPNTSTIRYLGEGTTNGTGVANITLVASGGGNVSIYVEFNGTIRTDLTDPITGGPKYFKASISQDYNISIYWRTTITLAISPTNPYTVEETTLSAKLSRTADATALSDQTITINLYKYNGVSWVLVSTQSGKTDAYGFYNITLTHITLGYGDYMFEAVFNGNNTALLDSVSSSQTYTVQITPTSITNLSYNATDRKVYDLIEFELDLIYDIGAGPQPVKGVTIYLYVNDTGTYELRNQTTTDQYGHAVIGYRPLRNGTYGFRIVYQGNTTYTSSEVTAVIGVRSRYTAFTNVLYPSSVSVGDTITLVFKLVDNETVGATINGTGLPGKTVVLQKFVPGTWVNIDSTTTASDGSGSFSWNEGSAGTYTYRILYSGTDYVYYPTNYTFTITVSTLTTSILVSVNNTQPYVEEPFSITARLLQSGVGIGGETLYLELYNGSSWIVIDSATTNATGYAVFTVVDNYAGTYTYRVRYAGSNVYSPAVSSNIYIYVKPLEVNITVSSAVGYVDEETNITARLTLVKNGTPITGEPINLYLWNGTLWNLVATETTNATGYAVFTLVLDNYTNYLFKVEFIDPGAAAGQRIYADNYTELSITPIKRPSDLYATVSNTTPMAGEYIVFTVNITDLLTGGPIVNGEINLYTNGTLTATATTNSTGYAVFNITPTTPGIYNYTIVFTGFVSPYLKYASDSYSFTVNVSKIKTLLYVNYTFPEKIIVGDVLSITGTLELYNGTALSNEKIVLEVYNGSTLVYTASDKTDPNGEYGFTYTFTGHGNYTITILYNGTVLYSRSLSLINVEVRYGVVIEILNATVTPVGSRVNVTLLIRAYRIPGATPLANETLEIYLSHSPATYIGNVTTNSTGYAVFSYLDVPYFFGATYTVSYAGTPSTWDNSTSIHLLYPARYIPQPLPEHSLLALILAVSLVIVILYRRRRS